MWKKEEKTRDAGKPTVLWTGMQRANFKYADGPTHGIIQAGDGPLSRFLFPFYLSPSYSLLFLLRSPFVSLTLLSRSDFGPDKRALSCRGRNRVSRYGATGLKYRPSLPQG